MQSSFRKTLAQWLPWRKSQLVEQLAGEVARQCRGSLWRRFSARTETLTIPEIRGYLAVRAPAYVEREVDAALTRHRLSLGLHVRVAAATVEQLIAMMIRDILTEQPTADVRTMAA